MQLNSIQFYWYIAFYNKIVSRCFTESETQSQNPQVSTVAGKNSLLTVRSLEQEPGLQRGTFLLRVGRVKDKNERETGQRE